MGDTKLGKVMTGEAGDTEMERYWMWLCSCPGLYRGTILALTEYFGSPKGVYEADARDLLAWKKLSDGDEMSWVGALTDYKDTVTASDAEARLARRSLRFVSRYSEEFPAKLRNLPDCPYGLFYRGSLPDETVPAVAVVGARLCSSYGTQMAEVIGKALAQHGYQVISGMAAGIDGTAQKACLQEEGRSFALLGCGADVCYPPENRSLYDRLPEKGGILSEFAPGTPPLRPHFPQRNRLISGLSDAVIVVEARAKSGSLITADLALDQGKEVYAVPGRYNDLLSYGCNRLIGQGAGIVLSTDRLLEELALTLDLQRVSPGGDCSSPEEERMLKGLSEDEQKVYRELNYDARSIDEIAHACGLTLLQTMTALLNLQMKERAEEVSKNRYVVKLAS